MLFMCSFRLNCSESSFYKLSTIYKDKTSALVNQVITASLVLFSIHRKHKNKPHRQKSTGTASESVNAVIWSHAHSFPRRSLSPLELPGAVSGDFNSRFKPS